jgi:hypothetical protein
MQLVLFGKVWLSAPFFRDEERYPAAVHAARVIDSAFGLGLESQNRNGGA